MIRRPTINPHFVGAGLLSIIMLLLLHLPQYFGGLNSLALDASVALGLLPAKAHEVLHGVSLAATYASGHECWDACCLEDGSVAAVVAAKE